MWWRQGGEVLDCLDVVARGSQPALLCSAVEWPFPLLPGGSFTMKHPIRKIAILALLALASGCACLRPGTAEQDAAAFRDGAAAYQDSAAAEQKRKLAATELDPAAAENLQQQAAAEQEQAAAELKHAATVAAALQGGSFPAQQLLAVIAEGKETSLARLYLLERVAGGWALKGGPLSATVGRHGFAAPGAKREGDGRTPSGLYPLESVFGYAAASDSLMPYRQCTSDDLWVDDPDAPDYNTWVKKGETRAASFERMLLPDPRYRHGIVIGYNRQPVVKGAGSAIFIHAWPQEGSSTAGCVSLDEAELVRVIRWLDPAKQPMILMGDRSDLAALPGLSALASVSAPPARRQDGADLERQVRRKLAQSGAVGAGQHYRGAGGFYGAAVPVPKAVEEQMHLKKSWREGCPMPISELDYLVLVYWGFDGRPHVGELVLHKKLAGAALRAFADLYAQRFPIRSMELIEKFDASDDRSMAANNTSAFNCRDVTGRPGGFSHHSYGTAIDINPVQNPYLVLEADRLKALGWNGTEDQADFLEKLGYPQDGAVAKFCAGEPANCRVLPPNARPFLSRARPAPGLLLPGPAVRAFTSRGFDWGGTWRTTVDYQHMEVKPDKLH